MREGDVKISEKSADVFYGQPMVREINADNNNTIFAVKLAKTQ